MQVELKQSILYGTTIWSDSTIEHWKGIDLNTIKKWLNHLGYKWKNI